MPLAMGCSDCDSIFDFLKDHWRKIRTNNLLERLNQEQKRRTRIIRLFPSKGVGIIFCTQSPADIPDHILGQLGFKVQYALRAFTAKDRKAIKLAAQNFPVTTFYQSDEMLTQLGIGEALITALNDKGIPTPLVHTLLKAPRSHMGLLDDVEIDQRIASSLLVQKYNREIDSKSAYEMLNEKIFQEKKTWSLDDILDSSIAKEVSRTIAKEISRAILGALVIALIVPIAASIIHLGISRSREYLADESGAHCSKDPLALASALEKLHGSVQKERMAPQNAAQATTGSLFIVYPFTTRTLSNLFSTHPPMEERIARLRKMAQHG
ncbi:MAG: DUF853 family protein [Chlamydiia bacterium]|nr:DUF853 family protein [Chlamydiia bacterium]